MNGMHSRPRLIFGPTMKAMNSLCGADTKKGNDMSKEFEQFTTQEILDELVTRLHFPQNLLEEEMELAIKLLQYHLTKGKPKD